MSVVDKVIRYGLLVLALFALGAWLNYKATDKTPDVPPKLIIGTPPPKAEFADGIYRVGDSIEVGSYKTRGPASGDVCSWSRNSGKLESLAGPGRVTLNKGDILEVSGGCEWIKS